MNPIILSFADGTTFFIGLVLVLATELLLLRIRRRWICSVMTVLVLLGMILVLISATPLPLWTYLIWATAGLAGLLVSNRRSPRRIWQASLYGLLLVTTTGMCIAEVPYHLMPVLEVPDGATVYVIGDSLSAETGPEIPCWPTLLAEQNELRVVNLAQVGATVDSAFGQSTNIPDGPGLVIVEIGGNDLLEGADVGRFQRSLERLVGSLHEKGHKILMVELPLMPFKNGFGRAQREIASRYDVTLLPKRCLSRVLVTENGTLDGLHLSAEGHRAMVDVLSEVMQPD